MKFAYKLSLAILVLLGVALSVVGTLTVSRNFQSLLDRTIEQNVEQHLVERYSLESKLVNRLDSGEVINNAALQEYGDEMTGYLGSTTRWLAIYNSSLQPVFQNLPVALREGFTTDMLENEEQGYYLRQYGESKYMLMSSVLEVDGSPLWILSAYDVTPVFEERDNQLAYMLWMDVAVLLVAGVLVVILSRTLTRPLRRLNLASRKIAGGAYDTRNQIETRDEIGELGENFNKMAAAVEAKMDELNASVQQREDFVAAFTHEVKTPMTAIIGYSDILRSQETDPETRQRAAQFIYRESRRLESLSQKLLVLMGLSGRQAELLPTSLHSIFTDAARSLIPALGEYELAMKQAEGIIVLADRDLAADLLRNLALNALKAKPADGTVRLGWQASPEGCRITISDTGCGIPPDELERIVEPFYMVDKSRARREGGSGVGLALAKRIAELHGTRLEFESEVGVGTTVSFILAEP